MGRTLRLNLCVLCFLCGACARAAPQADLRPIQRQNVLLITIDTLRADALGSYGGAAATPALDALAASGVRFDFAHAHAVLTLTSHASILTGTYPFQHGVRENGGYRMRQNARTAATLLKAAGYATAAFVGAFPLHSRFGLNQGFDVYDDRFGETGAPTDFVMPERPATAVVALARAWVAKHTAPSAEHAAPSTEHTAPSTEHTAPSAEHTAPSAEHTAPSAEHTAPSAEHTAPSTEHAAPSTEHPTLNTQHPTPGPWFVWVHVFDPHAPYTPPPPFDARYASNPYAGEVAATDAALAPLLDDLRAASTPTLVVVTGDHGEALGDHGEQSHGLFAYESTLRVPLIIAECGMRIADSGRIADSRGEVSSVAARHVDILPTILAAVAQPVPADLPGRSLLPASERRDGAAPRPSYFEAMSGMLDRGWAPLTGVIADRQKYIELPIPERYDLAADRLEQNNLAGKLPERDRALAATLRAFQPSLPGPRSVEDADAAARLRALGYTSGGAAPKAKFTDADDPKRLIAIDQQLHDAVSAYQSGRLDDAVRLYQQVIAARPDMAFAYRHLAFLQWHRGNAAEAIAVLQRAIKAGVGDPRALADLAGYLTDTGHIAEGIRLLEPLARSANADPETLNSLAIAYARTGRGDDARRVFERVLTIDPASSIPLENLGLLALERGDLGGAQAYFDRAVAMNPRSSRAQAGVGNVALKRGDRRAAIAAWQRAVELDPANFDALYNVGITLARDGRVGEARPYLERFVRTAPHVPFAKELEEVTRLLRANVERGTR